MGRRTGTRVKPPGRRAAAPALVPLAAASGPDRDDILAAMATAVATENPASTAEALRTLRLAFPHHPLALRLAALAIAMKRARPGGGPTFTEPGLSS